MLSNCTDQSANTYSHSAMEEAKRAIAESNAVYFQAYVNNDSSVFIDRYAKDACIMAPNTPQVCGHGEVAKFFRFSYDQYGMRNGKFVTTAVYGDAVEYVTEEALWQSFKAIEYFRKALSLKEFPQTRQKLEKLTRAEVNN